MADAPRLNVEQGTGPGLQRVADVAQCRAVGQDDLPVGTRPWNQLPAELRPRERPGGEGHDATMPLGGVADVQCVTERGLEAPNLIEARFGQLIADP